MVEIVTPPPKLFVAVTDAWVLRPNASENPKAKEPVTMAVE